LTNTWFRSTYALIFFRSGLNDGVIIPDKQQPGKRINYLMMIRIFMENRTYLPGLRNGLAQVKLDFAYDGGRKPWSFWSVINMGLWFIRVLILSRFVYYRNIHLD